MARARPFVRRPAPAHVSRSCTLALMQKHMAQTRFRTCASWPRQTRSRVLCRRRTPPRTPRAASHAARHLPLAVAQNLRPVDAAAVVLHDAIRTA
eukprot:2196902-Prymnesium_polylepis.1